MLSWWARMLAWDWRRRDWRHQEGRRGDMARGREDPGTPQTMGESEAAQPGRGGPAIRLLWSRSCRLRPRAGSERGSEIFLCRQIRALLETFHH